MVDRLYQLLDLYAFKEEENVFNYSLVLLISMRKFCHLFHYVEYIILFAKFKTFKNNFF